MCLKEMRSVHHRPASRWRMTCGRAVALAVVSCTLLVASVVAASEAESPTTEPVIPPGQEALIAGMLGRGMALPDCTLVSCGVDHTVIVATYSCLDGDVTLELGHPQNATDTSFETAEFAITVQSGTPPPDLQYALVSLVRSREADFVWGWQESAAAAENDDAPE
jgi:hypothetical protein